MDIDERVRLLEKETAIMGQMAKTHRAELNELFTLFRKHMDKEEEQREETIDLISNINNKLSSQRAFWAGMVFSFSTLTGLVVAFIKIS